MTARAGGNHDAGTTCRVLLYDNNELIRTGIRTVLDAEPDITVVAEAVRGSDLRGMIGWNRPDVIVSGFCPWLHNAGDHARRAATSAGQLPMVVLCAEPRGAELDRVIQIGARGLVLRSDNSRQVVEAVRAVRAGKAFLSPSVAGYVLEQLTRRMPPTDHLLGKQFELLTAREWEVLRLVASGLTTAEVAKAMNRSRATVKSHISHLLAKLGLQDRAQAIAVAYQAGLITNDAQFPEVADVAAAQ